MTSDTVATRDSFQRYHQHCDNCGTEANWALGHAVRGEYETAAGGFQYQLCKKCIAAFDKKAKPARQRAMYRALVRHAAYYSPDFGKFVAAWYGVPYAPSARLEA